MDQDRTSKADLVAALGQVPFGLLLFDAQMQLVEATPPVKKMLPSLAALLVAGAPCAALFGPDGSDLCDPHRTLPAEMDIHGIRLHAHKTVDGGMLVLVRDERETRDNVQSLTNVIEGGTVGTWEWEVDTGRLHVNEPWITMLGHTRADLEPVTLETWRRLLHPDDLKDLHAAFGAFLHPVKTDFQRQFRLRHANGGWVWVQSRAKVLRWSPDGLPAHMAGLHIDISAQKVAEQRLEHILEGAQVGTWQYNEVTGENNIDFRWAEMLGYRIDELMPMPSERFWGLMHADDCARLLDERLGRQTDGDWKFDNEIRLRHKDGHWVWVLSRGLVTEADEDRKPLVTSGVHIDISERKALQEALARERDFLAGLMEASLTGIMALDSEGRVMFANREAEIVMGRSADQLLGKSCSDNGLALTTLEGKPLGEAESPFYLALLSGEVQRGIKLQVSWPDGTRRTLLVNSAPLRLAGFDASVVCAVADITESVAAEQALRRAMERAEAGSRSKSEFLANMSHEIRTPLNGVLGMADVLGATLTTASQREMLRTIQQSGALLLSILNDILDLAKIESGRIVLEIHPFVPAELAQRTEALHGAEARAKGVDLVVLSDSGAWRGRMGDPQRVLQVLLNLVSNAVKFTERGEVRVTLTTRNGQDLQIEVTDTGIGMTPEQAEVVFQDFVQADGSITRRFGGTGLGLSIVRKLVAMMGGTVRLDSVFGQGTRAVVVLPLPDAPVAAPVLPVVPSGLSRLRALVAEDNATNRLILQSMLGAMGMRFTMVDDGEEAVAQWQPDRFDILLLDISMPRRDGLSALQAIKARAVALGVACPPALAVTANAMTHHLVEYREAGFAGCVAKPIRLEDLAVAIAGAVVELQPG